jgi:hypothetical protein
MKSPKTQSSKVVERLTAAIDNGACKVACVGAWFRNLLSVCPVRKREAAVSRVVFHFWS